MTYYEWGAIAVGAIILLWSAYSYGWRAGYIKQLKETCDQYEKEARQWKELMIDVGMKLAKDKKS